MKLSYVLITPARNEETYIEKTIQSVVSQTILPQKWIIVNDGSTDRTDEIVSKYSARHPWIQVIRVPEHRDRQFAAKVNCFNEGYQLVKELKYDIIANLDADISFEQDYFEFLLEKFSQIPELGVAGTPFIENGYNSMTDSFAGEKHVSGGCQLFRRKCFEDIGGYTPIKGGGIDWLAVTTARMKGWNTLSFKEKTFFHHRSLGTGNSNTMGAIFIHGKKDYNMGGHPLWEFFRIIYRLKKKPYIIGGLMLMSGYLWAFFCQTEKPVSEELIKFHRQEQRQKLKVILKRILKLERIKRFHADV